MGIVSCVIFEIEAIITLCYPNTKSIKKNKKGSLFLDTL